ncbi:unnamed protein product [Caenorhabditis auriculariae]|uniref:Uncharacterized protein n=1 Tax=Caenorhabditis auriculariae TaxID=2777116 RepID=A0A8S1H4C7_9PELO|nr:unnamed protein product [Caenorhabditis auriculariae]
MPPPQSPPETIVPQDFSKPVKLLTAKTLERTADQAIAKIIDVKNLKNAIVRDFVHTHHIIQKITESQNAKINTIKHDSSAAPPQQISSAVSDDSSDDDNGGFLSPTGVVTPTKAATSLQVALNSPACPTSLKPSTTNGSGIRQKTPSVNRDVQKYCEASGIRSETRWKPCTYERRERSSAAAKVSRPDLGAVTLHSPEQS